LSGKPNRQKKLLSANVSSVKSGANKTPSEASADLKVRAKVVNGPGRHNRHPEVSAKGETANASIVSIKRKTERLLE
jgi:hypothetical protein